MSRTFRRALPITRNYDHHHWRLSYYDWNVKVIRKEFPDWYGPNIRGRKMSPYCIKGRWDRWGKGSRTNRSREIYNNCERAIKKALRQEHKKLIINDLQINNTPETQACPREGIGRYEVRMGWKLPINL